jgi:hypothetical protein
MADGSDDRGGTGRASSAEGRGRSKAAADRKGKLATSAPPRFLNRIPSRASGTQRTRSTSLGRTSRSSRSTGGRSRIDYIPLTRVRFRGLVFSPVSPAWCVVADADGRADRGDGSGAEVPALLSLLAVGGRPFAPRVAIDRDHLPGGGRLALQSDYATRLARVGQLALSLEFPPWSPKRRGLSRDVGHVVPGHVLGQGSGQVSGRVSGQVSGGGISGVAFALLYSSSDDSRRSQRGEWMRTRAAIKSLDSVSLEEALAYLDASDGDELGAAFALATDRNELDGSAEAPDDAEVHHALFLLRRARKLEAPSFDLMRVQLKRRVAA